MEFRRKQHPEMPGAFGFAHTQPVGQLILGASVSAQMVGFGVMLFDVMLFPVFVFYIL